MSTSGPRWRDIEGFEGLYQINRKGIIRSLDRNVFHSGSKTNHFIKGRIIKPRVNNMGYVSVTLSRDGENFTRFVHRLLAIAFIPNPENKCEVNHKNLKKTDNRLCNLEWVTHSENMKHAIVKKRGKSVNSVPKFNKSFCGFNKLNRLLKEIKRESTLD